MLLLGKPNKMEKNKKLFMKMKLCTHSLNVRDGSVDVSKLERVLFQPSIFNDLFEPDFKLTTVYQIPTKKNLIAAIG